MIGVVGDRDSVISIASGDLGTISRSDSRYSRPREAILIVKFDKFDEEKMGIKKVG